MPAIIANTIGFGERISPLLVLRRERSDRASRRMLRMLLSMRNLVLRRERSDRLEGRRHAPILRDSAPHGEVPDLVLRDARWRALLRMRSEHHYFEA
jgi:hypothetical protein